MQEINGKLFPEDVEVPDQHWYRIEFGTSVMWDLNGDGYVDLAHQRGVESIETDVINSGIDDKGIQFAVCQTTVKFPDGTFSSVAGADETSQQVRDPEHCWSVAGTRSVKRAVSKALNIQDSESEATDDDQGSPPPTRGDDDGPDPATDDVSPGNRPRDDGDDMGW